MGKIKLSDEDWKELFPSTFYQLGKTNIPIVPLGLEDFSKVIGLLGSIRDKIKEKNITMETYQERLPELLEAIVMSCPEVLSRLSNVEEASIKKMPLSAAVGLLDACLEANIGSQGALLKNWKALAGKMGSLMPGQETI